MHTMYRLFRFSKDSNPDFYSAIFDYNALDDSKIEGSVFRVLNNRGCARITVEKKCFSTWFRAHTFWSHEYKLKNVFKALKYLNTREKNIICCAIKANLSQKDKDVKKKIGDLFKEFFNREISIPFAPAPTDAVFASERDYFRHYMNLNDALAPFHNLSDAMLTFVFAEKLKLCLTPLTRYAVENGEAVAGYLYDYEAPNDQYHPQVLKPFFVKAFWIPATEGKLFSLSDASPLVRFTERGEKEVLFLVHPKSESLFLEMMKKFADRQFLVPALSLSSFRTLLVAIPTESDIPHYAMVKVSLNERIGGASRIVSLKECAGSIARAEVLASKHFGISLMKEDCSFVIENAGMIHRSIPECLLNGSGSQIIPLFSLFGKKNRLLLDVLIKQSMKTPTEFIKHSLLSPLADLCVNMLYFNRTSLELHAQNLLLILNTDDSENVNFSFMYRDMGGVNCLLSNKEMEMLPDILKSDEYFYFDSHDNDAAEIWEKVARNILYNLTKLFFKSNRYDQTDLDFSLWKKDMIERGYHVNWTVPGDEQGDGHVMELRIDQFYRYGYFEKIFGILLLEVMEQKGIFRAISETVPSINRLFFQDQLINPQNPYNNCFDLEWFSNLVLQTYPIYRKSVPPIQIA